jgi:hypothetical protein
MHNPGDPWRRPWAARSFPDLNPTAVVTMALVYPRKKVRLYNPEVESIRQAHYRSLEARAAQAEPTPVADPVQPPESVSVSQPPVQEPVQQPELPALGAVSLPHNIPANWRKLPFPELRALAQRLSGTDTNLTRDESRAIIAAFAGVTES